MRTSRWAIGALVVAAILVLLALTGRKSVHAERVIPRSAEAIWTALMDTGRYGEWNPIFVSAEGRFEEGGHHPLPDEDGGWRHDAGGAPRETARRRAGA